MSVKKSKHKRKTAQQNRHVKKTTASILSRYPRFFLVIGSLLVLIGGLLLTIGYVSDARIGLSMISLFFGVAIIIFASAAIPKKIKH